MRRNILRISMSYLRICGSKRNGKKSLGRAEMICDGTYMWVGGSDVAAEEVTVSE